MNVSKALKEYVESDIMPMYDDNYIGEGRDRVEYVIKRSEDIIRENDIEINYDMLYVVICYHDIRKDNKEKGHELDSANIMYEDVFLKNYFTDEERTVIKEAIEDQRANFDGEPRNIYGKLLSSASRNSSVEQCLERSYYYGKKIAPNATDNELYERAYEALSKKFGENGYAKFYFKDSVYERFLKEIRELLVDKDTFINKQREYIKGKNS